MFDGFELGGASGVAVLRRIYVPSNNAVAVRVGCCTIAAAGSAATGEVERIADCSSKDRDCVRIALSETGQLHAVM